MNEEKHTVTFLNIDSLGPQQSAPDNTAQVTARLDRRDGLDGRRFRVVHARVDAEFTKSWIGRLARRIPGLGRLFVGRDARDRARAGAQMQIWHVAIDNYQCAPDEIDQLPVAKEGSEIVVVVVNKGDKRVAARVVVEGTIS